MDTMEMEAYTEHVRQCGHCMAGNGLCNEGWRLGKFAVLSIRRSIARDTEEFERNRADVEKHIRQGARRTDGRIV